MENKKKTQTKENKAPAKKHVSRRVVLAREENTPWAAEEDIMLAVNKELERTKVPKEFRASRVTYSKGGSVSILFIEKVDAEKLCEE